MEFLPFVEVRNTEKVVVVDSFFRGKSMLSHWRGAPRIAGIHDDTSTGIVLNAIKAGHPACQYQYCSNNHFDIDGFLGIWALLNPELALKHEAILREAALIGDFREWKPKNETSQQALLLCIWINSLERELFYEPFGEKNEAASCIPKYQYFLPRLQEYLFDPGKFKVEAYEEYFRILEDQKMLEAEGRIERLPDIGLQIVYVPAPLHYYVLFQESQAMEMVLSLYEGNRYELEYKYTSWVDTAKRNFFPRISFQKLANKLNEREESNYQWEYDSIMDTGPMLRLHKSGLSKAERYDHPYNRALYTSSIEREDFLNIVIDHYRTALSKLQRRTNWTWKEMREVIT
ncbi:MAG: DUF6687 family protein [Bacteroidota bacterium]